MKVVVFIARGLQASSIGCYGNDWIATPALDQLAGEGVVFDWHYDDGSELDAVLSKLGVHVERWTDSDQNENSFNSHIEHLALVQEGLFLIEVNAPALGDDDDPL